MPPKAGFSATLYKSLSPFAKRIHKSLIQRNEWLLHSLNCIKTTVTIFLYIICNTRQPSIDFDKRETSQLITI